MSIKQLAIITLSTIAGIFLAVIFNFIVLENILIPDPCYYHSHDTNMLFDLFYELTASEGYHPFPTRFNFILTICIGALAGFTLSKRLIRKRSLKRIRD